MNDESDGALHRDEGAGITTGGDGGSGDDDVDDDDTSQGGGVVDDDQARARSDDESAGEESDDDMADELKARAASSKARRKRQNLGGAKSTRPAKLSAATLGGASAPTDASPEGDTAASAAAGRAADDRSTDPNASTPPTTDGPNGKSLEDTNEAPTIERLTSDPPASGMDFDLKDARKCDLDAQFAGIPKAGSVWRLFRSGVKARGTGARFPPMNVDSIAMGDLVLVQPAELIGLCEVRTFSSLTTHTFRLTLI